MTLPAVLAGHALVGGRLERDWLLTFDAGGRIASSGPRAGKSLPPGSLDLSDRIVIPGTCNSHSHAFQVLLRGRCETAASFQDWVARFLYPLVQVVELEDLRAASRLAFCEMLQNGVTTVGEFHYLHRRPGGSDGANEYAEALLDSAREVGLRIALLRSFYTQGGRPGRERFVETAQTARTRLEELASACAEDPLVSVAPAPHSLHGCNEEGFHLAADWSRAHSRPLHVHLAEQRSDLEFARKRWGASPLRALQGLGVLDDRLVAVHGCWLDSEEIAMLGAAGAGLAYNPASNMALGDGISDLQAMSEAGVRISLGTDGACANNQFDVFREMRTAEHLQRIKQLRMGVLTPGRGGAALFEMGARNGYLNLGLDGGEIAAGRLADLLSLDPDEPSLHPLWREDASPEEAASILQNQLAFSVSIRPALRDVIVGGQHVLAEGRPTRVDPGEAARALSALSVWDRMP